MKPTSFIHSCAAVLLLGVVPQVRGDAPEAIYYNGQIYTMIRDGDRVEALAVNNGKISAAGSGEEILATKGADKTWKPGDFEPLK